MKKIRNQINGVLLLDKPKGMSSNQAIQKVKYILNAEKVGHTGTLDPMATGLLPVCLGEATKFANYLLDGDKTYIATLQFGIVTDSGDSEGNIISRNEVHVNLDAIKSTLIKFTGPITQIPPMYSALKHNGRRLYEYAREGITIERDARQINIYHLNFLTYDTNLAQLVIEAKVSKGTYIRTLAEDIGNELGCGASLIALRRTQTNQFSIDQAVNFISLEESSQQATILPPEILCSTLQSLSINPDQYATLKYGNPTLFEDLPRGLSVETEYTIFANGKFLGIAQFSYKDNRLMLCPKRLINQLNSCNPWGS